MTKACAYCGKEFETKHSFKKYCSDECRKRQEKELEKKNKGKKKKYEKECEECHKKFLTSYKVALYCDECRAKRKEPFEKKQCVFCGEWFTPYIRSQKYCNSLCREKEKAKKKREGGYIPMEKKETSLDKKLKEAKESGKTYGDLQREKILESVPKIML